MKYLHRVADAKYGAASAAKPKVFFKYFYVNTTDEKLGDVLLEGKFAAK